MAVPVYSEDLTDIDLAESASTGWTAFNISGGGGGAPAFGTDLGMQGAGAWDKACSNAERGLAVNKTPGAGTVAADVHIFVWGFAATPGITDNLATRGAYVIVGTSTNNFMQFHVEGNDTYGAAGRVGKCYAVDYVTTSNTGSIPYRTVNGTPGATPTYFGFGLKTTATAKGSNMGCDAVRYGKGGFITAGDVSTPATFAGFNTQNDNINNRWGILTDLGGTFEWQGWFVVGQNNAGTPTQAYFDDSSGLTITLVDTVHSTTDFTRLVIDQADTVFNCTGATFLALGTNNPGTIIINDASASSTGFTSCVFDGLGAIGGHANIDYLDCTFKGCGVITAIGDMAGSSVEGYEGTVDTGAVDWTPATNPSGNLDDMDFTMGTAATHAIEFSDVTISTINLTGLTFSGYGADASTSAELYFARTTGTITVNLSGMSTPTYKSAGATIDFVQSVTLTVTVTDQDGVAVASPRVSIRRQSDNSEESQGTASAGGIYTDASYAYSSDLPVFVRVRLSSTAATRYFPAVAPATITSNGLNVSVTLVEDSIVAP